MAIEHDRPYWYKAGDSTDIDVICRQCKRHESAPCSEPICSRKSDWLTDSRRQSGLFKRIEQLDSELEEIAGKTGKAEKKRMAEIKDTILKLEVALLVKQL